MDGSGIENPSGSETEGLAALLEASRREEPFKERRSKKFSKCTVQLPDF